MGQEDEDSAVTGAWAEVSRLVEEQKMAEALKVSDQILEDARKSGDAGQETKALVQVTQLRIALDGFETAVRYLKDNSWPQSMKARVTLDLYYAQSLLTYLSAYNWEIRQRETVQSKEAVDLKAWTAPQIHQEALKAYADAWKMREELGELPVGALKEYIDPNDYPAGVRGTLRDTITYLLVQDLANTSNWTPAESNEVHRLKLGQLVSGHPKKVAPDDPAKHPLERIAAILDEHEQWHAGADRKEAALEARLERVRRLHASFSDHDDRASLIKHLTDVLQPLRSLPWWAMGMAEIAEMQRTQGDRVAAQKAAQAGAEAFPLAIGGLRCLAVQKSIEAPDVEMSGMRSDAAGKRSLSLQHRNLKAMYFRAYPLDLTKRVEGAKDYELLPGTRLAEELLKKNEKPAKDWVVELPATPDYQMHQTFVTPPLTKQGLYMIIASTDASFATQRILTQNVIITDLVIVARRESGGQLDLSVVKGSDGAPVAGAEVRIYKHDYNTRNQLKATLKTDAKGAVRFKQTGEDYGSYFAIARLGNDVALTQDSMYMARGAERGTVDSTFVYTDRSIYRPQQKIQWKVLAFSGSRDAGAFKVAPNAKMTVQLHDANYEVVEEKSVTTNAFGTASGEFLIPAGRLLGSWSIQASRGMGSSYISVEEYKRPTFEVSLKDPEAALRLNRPAELKGEARYYFGLPVTAGTVQWRVTRSPRYPWWYRMWGYATSGSGTQTIATGSSPLQADGTFALSFTPEASEKEAETPGMSYSYDVDCDLTDEGGETRSAARTFRLGFTSVEATLSWEEGFFTADKPIAITVRRASLDGAGRAGKGSYHLFKIAVPEQVAAPADLPLPDQGKAPGFNTPGDRQRARTSSDFSAETALSLMKDGAEVRKGDLEHDASGSAALTLPGLAAGAYRVRYETTDDFGTKTSAWRDFLVAAPQGSKLGVPAYMAVEKRTLAIGEKARILVYSGIAGQTLVLDVARDSKLVERRFFTGGTSPEILELPVTEAERGGFAVTLSAVCDHQHIVSSQQINVPYTNKELKVSFASFRDKIRPGSHETWKVTVKGPGDKTLGAGAAEVLAYMYDKSLDVFAAHNPPNPLSLYPTRAQGIWPELSLGIAHGRNVGNTDFPPPPAAPGLSPDRLKFYDGNGIGGLGLRRQAKKSLHGYGRARTEAPMEMADAVMAEPTALPSPTPSDDAPKGEKSANAGKSRDDDDDADKKDREGGKAPGAPGPTPELRSNFVETAFFLPHLTTGADGSVALEFTVPDSVTAYNVWVHALTKDMAAGSLLAQTKAVKELMVRPYLPRFFREGDQATLKIVVNNAGDAPLAGQLDFKIIDDETGADVSKDFGVTGQDLAFDAKPGASANVSVPVTAPRRVGVFAIQVTATSGAFSDGERRPLPLLPSRMRLMQSRFVTLRDQAKRTMTFEDLAKDDDPTRQNEQMVVTIDGQLFYGVLKSLPYLVEYPYECTEQTLNRFVSTAIVSSVFHEFPAVGKMAKALAAQRGNRQLETFQETDPNRKMTLEESPWLAESRGGRVGGEKQEEGDLRLLKILDPKVANAQKAEALAKLQKSQTSNGGFPWFSGGPPSPYITLYLLHGFAKAKEFGVAIPEDTVGRAWQYVAQHLRSELIPQALEKDCCWEELTFLNYVASMGGEGVTTLTKAERDRILQFSFKHWKEHSPLLKAYLALTLKRANRAKDAALVFASVMDSAKTDPDLGTYWAAEDRSWLWYNDTIETHAFALRTLTELDPADKRRDGLVQWLFLNKKLNHWKSTRATAESIYALVHFLKADKSLGVREEAKVTVGPLQQTVAFEPDTYAGRAQIVVPGATLDAKTQSSVVVEKATKGFMFASATWHFSTEALPKEASGDFFGVTRAYFKRSQGANGFTLSPLAEGAKLAAGDEVEVQLSLKSKHEAEFVHLRDPRAAGFEPQGGTSGYRWDLGISWYEEIRDSGMNFFFEQLPVGEYTFKYRLRAATAGTFRVGPATVQSMYAPEFAAYSQGQVVSISP